LATKNRNRRRQLAAVVFLIAQRGSARLTASTHSVFTFTAKCISEELSYVPASVGEDVQGSMRQL
jgi:hypothetical protein